MCDGVEHGQPSYYRVIRMHPGFFPDVPAVGCVFTVIFIPWGPII
ncbi:hypothetical protein HMPREF0742_01530 [Rothia aeria F0184]|uniref:Uncharacterized protein n=1 Tax=Rothia aeria F0184 TaxID=888019 RepID=U7V574_9MICC|nr:hypothetical protein HMPREF0742_01530 [Rothia aeria F0184]